MPVQIHCAVVEEAETAFRIVEEYNGVVGVQVRDAWESFPAVYFGEGSGIWLATTGGEVVGCIALRPLPQRPYAGEVKRLYVRPEFRGQGIADALLEALEEYARTAGYAWIYLDSKDDLKAALRFYARHGYEGCERYNSNPQAAVFMRKGIGGSAS